MILFVVIPAGFTLACPQNYAGKEGIVHKESFDAKVIACGGGVTAVHDADYHFSRWSDGSLANPRSDANVTGDISVTAVFNKKIPWSLWVPAMTNGARLQDADTLPNE
ncbi:MAG: hypothetical protein Q7U64_14690 [Desulfocapsaceae bacterium]|nr:hypothetical protein [Desulfocapsaceae bacterium]